MNRGCLESTIGLFWGIIIWGWIISSVYYVNDRYTDNPWTMILVEILAVIVIVFLIKSIINNRSKYCIHKNKKDVCIMCEQEQKQKELKYEAQLKADQIKSDAQKLYREECQRFTNLKFQRASNLLNLTPNEFEDSISSLFRDLGYSVTQTPYVNDGGKDAIAFKDDVKYLLEYKRYARDKSIGRPMLQKLHAAMIEEKADKGIFITTAFYTSTAYDYAKKYSIQLINGDELAKILNKVYPNSEEELYYRQMCIDCGDILELSILDDKSNLTCKSGHTMNPKKPVQLSKSNNYNYRYYKKKRRYYRR